MESEMSTRSDATMTISEIFVELQVPPHIIISICPNEWLLDELHVDVCTALEFKMFCDTHIPDMDSSQFITFWNGVIRVLAAAHTSPCY